METQEVWKPIVGWEGYYEVSNRGRIKMVPHLVRTGVCTYLCKGKICKLVEHVRKGSMLVFLWKNNKNYSRYVHQLVLEAFVGPKPAKMECCHFDGNHKNNNLENLRWDTRKSNIEDRRRHGTLPEGERHGNHKLIDEEIIRIRKAYSERSLSKIRTQRQLANEFRVSRTCIEHIVLNQTWRHLL